MLRMIPSMMRNPMYITSFVRFEVDMYPAMYMKKMTNTITP